MPDGVPGEPGQPGGAGGAGGAGDHPRRGPGWREVLLLGGAILAAVLLLEVASAAIPPVREAFQGLPVTVIVLITGTIGLLVIGARRRPRA